MIYSGCNCVGIVSLSGYLPARHTFPNWVVDDNRQVAWRADGTSGVMSVIGVMPLCVGDWRDAFVRW